MPGGGPCGWVVLKSKRSMAMKRWEEIEKVFMSACHSKDVIENIPAHNCLGVPADTGLARTVDTVAGTAIAHQRLWGHKAHSHTDAVRLCSHTGYFRIDSIAAAAQQRTAG